MKIYSQIPCHRGPHRMHELLRKQKEQGNTRARAFIVVSRRQNGQYRVSRFWIG